jgi:dienelactone hydrolase
MVDAAMATFRRHSCLVTLLSLEGARHGFTNPAQDFNPNPSFGFNADAANKSWHAATLLLKNELNDTPAV